MSVSTQQTSSKQPPLLSVLIPASNEEALIAPCLDAVLASAWSNDGMCEVIVISNGSTDQTTRVALSYKAAFAKKGWALLVLDRKEGGKLAALNSGDQISRSGNRVYLDADVEVSPELLTSLYRALNTSDACYVSGQLVIAKPQSRITRAYARVYQKVPFMQHGVPGAGLFAVNAAGRLRWGAFPDIISDDTFVRLCFRPNERVGVTEPYTWPLVEGWRNLVRVRKRQNAGVDEIKEHYSHLLENDDKPDFPLREKLKLAVKDPVGFAVYAGVALAVRLSPGGTTAWSRGR